MDPIKPIRDKLSKPLWKQIEAVEPHVSKGGDFHYLHSSFDAMKTFLFAPPTVTRSGAHIRDGADLKRTMFIVILAMLPCLLHGIVNVGHMHYVANGEYLGLFDGFWLKLGYGLLKVVPLIIVSYAAGLGVEMFFAQKRGHAVNEGFLVSGMLIPLIMPPDIPLWMVALATVFAVIIGKEAFGGTGMNILNVALTARVFIFFAYPGHMSGDQVWIAGMPDGYTGASILGAMAADGMNGLKDLHYLNEGSVTGSLFGDLFFGFIPGSIGETSKLAILLGAGLLILTGVGSWRIMLTVIVGAMVTGAVFNIFATDATPFLAVPTLLHMVSGSLLFAAVFMATDPVTATQTEKGKYIYGFLIGVFGMIIRVTNPAYPEGWMLAILLMNVFAPLIDHMIVQSNIKKRLARG